MSDSTLRVLFDEPGPRARRRIRVITVVTVLVFAALAAVVVAQFGARGQLAPDKWAEFTQWPYVRFLLDGLGQTLGCTLAAGAVAFPLGILLALGRLSSTTVVSKVVGAWVEVWRSVPLLLVIYVFIGVLPGFGLNLPIFWKLVIPIILCSSPVIAEVVRAGVLALPRGQTEAALAIGMSRAQTMRHVVLPQAIRLVVPSLVTQVISLLKDSTLGYAASYPELMYQSKTLTAFSGHLIQTFLVVSVIYIVLNLLLSQLARHLESRQGRRRAAKDARDRLAAELAPSAT